MKSYSSLSLLLSQGTKKTKFHETTTERNNIHRNQIKPHSRDIPAKVPKNQKAQNIHKTFQKFQTHLYSPRNSTVNPPPSFLLICPKHQSPALVTSVSK